MLFGGAVVYALAVLTAREVIKWRVQVIKLEPAIGFEPMTF